jgi:hypothetical protein
VKLLLDVAEPNTLGWSPFEHMVRHDDRRFIRASKPTRRFFCNTFFRSVTNESEVVSLCQSEIEPIDSLSGLFVQFV